MQPAAGALVQLLLHRGVSPFLVMVPHASVSLASWSAAGLTTMHGT